MKKKYIVAAVLILIAAITAVCIFVTAKTKEEDISTTLSQVYPDSESVVNNTSTGVMVIDENYTYQTMKGFGCSAFSWAATIGGFNNCDEFISLLFSETEGIGLNIYRYHLGAGSQGDSTISKANRQTQNFISEDGSLDFSADAHAQHCLMTANQLSDGRLRVELSAYSPPVQYTKNGLAYSLPDASQDSYSSNIAPENYNAYAKYLYDCAVYFTGKGYRVTSISPISEPRYSHKATNKDGELTIDKEGCFYQPAEVAALYTEIADVFSQAPQGEVKILLPECGEAEGEGSVTAAYINSVFSTDAYTDNPSLMSDSVSVHSYWSSAEKKQQFSAFMHKNYPSTGISCTYYSQLPNDGSNGILEYLIQEEDSQRGLTIEYALPMAETIFTDLTVLYADEWCWGEACSFSDIPDGLIYADADNPENIEISKRLWVLGNFSRFIKEGAIRIASSTGNEALPCLTFRNPDQSTVCIFLNRTQAGISTDMSALLSSSAVAYITDATRDLQEDTLISEGILTVPEQSIVTVIF